MKNTHDYKIATMNVAANTNKAKAVVVPFQKEDTLVIDQQVPNVLKETLGKESMVVLHDGVFYSFVALGKKKSEYEKKIAAAIKAVPTQYSEVEVWIEPWAFNLKNLATTIFVETANKWNAKSKKKDDEDAVKSVVLVDPAFINQAEMVEKAKILAHAQLEVIRLVEMPSNYLTPKVFYETAKSFVDAAGDKVSMDAVIGDNLQIAGYGSMYAVSKGSVEDGYMITLKYNGGAENEAPIVLVGKGLTFDSGGISIKPSRGMGRMKGDMAGAATAFGSFMYAVNSGLKKNIVVILACAENMPDGNSVKPGDIITAKNGKTIEVEDTDAEGRLVLADALCLAQTFKGKYTVDFATLTGACIVALGHVHTGMFTEDETLADKLKVAGLKTGDTVWQLPMGEEYSHFLDSKVADLNNLCIGQGGGATNGAIFLKEFAPATGWCHLDIAGTSEVKSATGRPLPLMAEFLDNL